MTVAAGFHAGDFIFFVADVRQMAKPGEHPDFADDCEKLSNLPFGLVASAGSVGLGQFGAYLMERAADPRGVTWAIEHAIKHLSNSAPDIIAEQAQKTSWLVSYRNGSGLVLGSFEHSRQFREWSVVTGQSVWTIPVDLTESAIREVDEMIHGEFRSIMLSFADGAGKAAALARLCRKIVAVTSSQCATVSPSFQFGLHMPDGRTFISNIMSPGEECRWRTPSRAHK